MRSLLVAFSLALAIAACNSSPTAPDVKVYVAALTAKARLASDLERDTSRKPDAVFAYLGIQPGMQVLDVFSGGGYTTEYAAWLVGPTGHVTAFNPQPFEDYVKDEVATRFAAGRLPNVDRVVQALPLAADALTAARYDAAIMVQNYHDVYWVHEPNWKKVDGPALLAAIKASLKPGAVFGVVDHAAAAGTGTSAAQTLHRIEKAALIADFKTAGFVLDGESPVLANPADDHSKSVFDDSIRGKTDQFVLRFRKPR
jgi:predicted methyltransferase